MKNFPRTVLLNLFCCLIVLGFSFHSADRLYAQKDNTPGPPTQWKKLTKKDSLKYNVKISSRRFHYETGDTFYKINYNLSFTMSLKPKDSQGNVKLTLSDFSVTGSMNDLQISYPGNTSNMKSNVLNACRWFNDRSEDINIYFPSDEKIGDEFKNPKSKGMHPVLFARLLNDVNYVLWNMFGISKRINKRREIPEGVDYITDYTERNDKINDDLKNVSLQLQMKSSKIGTSQGMAARLDVKNGTVFSDPTAAGKMKKTPTVGSGAPGKGTASTKHEEVEGKAGNSSSSKFNVGSVGGQLRFSSKNVLEKLQTVKNYDYDSSRETSGDSENQGKNSGSGNQQDTPKVKISSQLNLSVNRVE